MSPLRLRNLVSMVRSMYADAVLDHLIGINPAARVKLPRFDQERIVPLTAAQVLDLADTVPDRNRAMVIVQAGVGLRIGELLADGLNLAGIARVIELELQVAGLRAENARLRSKHPR